MAQLDYKRLEIRYISTVLVSYPVDATKLHLSETDFIQDAYVMSMKPGVALTFSSDGYVKPAGASGDETIIGYLVQDLAGYPNRNKNGIATGMATVLLAGSGNVFITDNVVESDITVGTKLFVGADGRLTSNKANLEAPVAVAVSANSASNKALIVQTI